VASAIDIPELVEGADVVWFDEPNHFSDEYRLIGIVPELRKDSIILVSGLGATSELEPFGTSMAFFLATADHVHWLTADCDACGDHGVATRSLYIGSSPKSDKVKVGGAESYRPVCPDCWAEFINLPTEEKQRWMKVF
jgi:thymidine kinase